ncbi:MAG: hypothetical protein CL472_09200 [Acidobacteria bacterium]|nr:hypothetical protein [Acidobacteriota bacterium]
MSAHSLKSDVTPEDRELFILLTSPHTEENPKAVRSGLLDRDPKLQAIAAFRVNAIATATQKGLYKSVLTHNLNDSPLKGERFDLFAVSPQDAIEIATREARRTGYPRVMITGPIGNEIYRGTATP